jgi:HSP20 family protein
MEENIMSITRWDPFRELETFNERLNRMFGRSSLLGQASGDVLANVDWSPAVDVVETPEEYLVKAELPDLRKEDVKVSVESGMLRIAGERKQEKEEKHKRFHRVERSYGSFVRTFGLPDNVDDKKLQAEFKDGLLTVHLHKISPSKPPAVEVKIT